MEMGFTDGMTFPISSAVRRVQLDSQVRQDPQAQQVRQVREGLQRIQAQRDPRGLRDRLVRVVPLEPPVLLVVQDPQAKMERLVRQAWLVPRGLLAKLEPLVLLVPLDPRERLERLA